MHQPFKENKNTWQKLVTLSSKFGQCTNSSWKYNEPKELLNVTEFFYSINDNREQIFMKKTQNK